MTDLKNLDLKRADLHIHTYYSDGQASPSDIVKAASNLGYEVISITDHDGVDGVKEAVEAGKREGVRVIPGIELAAETEEGTGFHILGYGMDIENSRFISVLSELSEKRERRNRKLLEILADMGYPLLWEDLKRQQPNDFIGKPVIARALAAEGYIKDTAEAFERGRFLGSPEARAVKKEKLNTGEAIKLITGAGGEAVMAHPIQTRGQGEPGSEEFYANIEELAKTMKREGLAGMECYHPDQSRTQTETFLDMAGRLGLYPTRGSDFHGKDYSMAERGAGVRD